MACNCISRVEKMVKEKTNESGCLDTSIGIPSGIAMVNRADALNILFVNICVVQL